MPAAARPIIHPRKRQETLFVDDAPTLAIFQSKNEPYLSFGFSLVTESFWLL